MMKVFVSGTYHDLKPYRDAVNEQLRRMKVEGIDMEYFATASEDATTLSLKELEQANIYVGIIGHRYGSKPSGRDHSITRLEYERAEELSRTPGRMRLLIYLADENSVPLPPNMIESDALRQAQQEFRRLLAERHTPRRFATPQDLSNWISADLFRILQYRVQLPVREETVKLFDAHELDKIREEFDTNHQEQQKRIEDCVTFVANQFKDVFLLEPWNVHPLLHELSRKLEIPGILLDQQEGVILRTGVRHVILRAKTFQYLVRNLDDGKLDPIGFDIGQSAAEDLVKHTIEARKLIPKSADALIALWDYWDRTGGWGCLKAGSEPAGGDTNSNGLGRVATAGNGALSTRAGEGDQPAAKWVIHLENNGLAIEDPKGSAESNIAETNRLAKFWCGYARGFLNIALVRISDIVAELKQEDRNQVTLPVYNRVNSVQHAREGKTDTFTIQFEPDRFSDARQRLVESQRRLKEGKRRISIQDTLTALDNAREAAGSQFDDHIRRMGLAQDEVIQIYQLLSGTLSPIEAEAEHWFRLVNLVVQHLSRNLERQSATVNSSPVR